MLAQQIKADCMTARKARDSFRVGVLTTLLGDVQRIGKDAGNRETTDDETLKVIRKFIKGIDQTLELSDKNKDVFLKEREILDAYLPDEMSEEDLENAIIIIINDLRNDNSNTKSVVVGTVMRELKAAYDNYDGKMASTIVRGKLS